MIKLIDILAYFTAFVIVFLGILLFGCVISLPLYLMWNWLMPSIFGLPIITLPQAFGLYIFVYLLGLGVGKGNFFSPSRGFSTIGQDTYGTDEFLFGDLTWNQWVEQVRKKYQA